MRTLTLLALVALTATMLAGCSGGDGGTNDGSSGNGGNGGDGNGSTGGNEEENPYSAPSSTTQLSGSGSTFIGPLMESWAIQFSREESKVQASYAKTGSGAGRTSLFNKDVFFAASDAPLTPQQKSDNPGILQFPGTLGAIAMGYNVQGVSDGLKLDGETIGKMYTGGIRKWNDAAIASQNPGVDLPSADIALVRRSDSSGTTFAWSDFVAKTSPSWRAAYGNNPATSFSWSAASTLAGNGNDGVADLVKKTPNSIGYMELAYVFAKDLDAAAVKSKDGAYLMPTVDGASAAADAYATALPAVDGDWSQVSIVNAPGAESYPISTYAYILVYQSLDSYGSKATAAQQDAFQAWMWWCLHDGQAYAEALGYAPLPDSVVDLGEGALASLTS